MAKKRKRSKVTVIESTPETIKKKRALVGKADLSYAESPTGVMVARKIITVQEEHNLNDVAKLWRFRNGKATPQAAGDGLSEMEQDSERKTRKYWEMSNALGIMYWPIIEVAVYKTYPDWLISQISFRKLNRDESRRMKLFFSGLDKLTGIWGMSS